MHWGIITGDLVLLLVVGIFIINNRSASQTVRSSTVSSIGTTANSQSSPLDQLSSDQIAYQVAHMVKLPELTMAHNRADSATALLAVVPNDPSTLAKPQIVSTAQKSRLDIVSYRVTNGDSVDSLARKFRVSINSIRWSNDLNGNSLAAGSTLHIPPAEGVVYKVQATDTIDSIVNRYQANRNTFITVNDAENNNLKVGELVWIPNAIQPVVALPAAAAFSIQTTEFNRIRSGSYFYSGPDENNGYSYGYCTYWVAHRRIQIGSPVPPNLGDAYTWATAAQQQGLQVSFKPQAGAVITFPGRNHVAFVESIKKNGDVVLSEMNAVGWNMVNSGIIPASQTGNYKYIY